MNLKSIQEEAYKNAVRRAENGAAISVATMPMLKHTATEVIEATEAYVLLEDSLEFITSDPIVYRDKFSQELADIICCVAIIAEHENIDLDDEVRRCLEKNRLRAEGKGDKK